MNDICFYKFKLYYVKKIMTLFELRAIIACLASTKGVTMRSNINLTEGYQSSSEEYLLD